MQIRYAREAELTQVYEVLKELRTELSESDFAATYERARANDGFAFAVTEREGRIVAVAGFRILWDYVHGKHLYVDDLVTIASERSQGVGAKLLAWTEAEAKRQGCAYIRLSTGVDNHEAKRFYEREGWQLKSVTYKKKF